MNELHTARPTSAVAQWIRRIYLLGVALLAGGIVLQVFFAGASMLVEPAYLSMHRIFAHLIELHIMALLLVGLVSRLPWRIQGLGGLLFVLMFMQYVFLYLMPALGLPALRALHAVNALAMFWLTVYLLQRTWRVSQA